jgi:cell division protein FtsB|tara:strand:- start:2560 stop:2868 length:309 start_codon:yes stop_codon:yes gene_type:complete
MNKKFTNFFKNPMVFIVLIFVIWMIFFDTNSLIIHNELSNDIDKLNNQKKYFTNEINKDKSELKLLQTDSGLEKYAREKLFMKKENEDIFLIEYDTLRKNEE